ncbi:hypothetical protein Poli38472_003197 [Pythium oligandrum]|uniref:Uncharacterized protein n=1 Tax=Pythium oligandrum TaxID=41045 RepID=A0A8K1FF37_PYTOL|nr:hypothetical protein Poli38472_003197 [Pythium oligandrum]|eukprot:TMW57272.1 hypothetical protein Poli38472_003197 [Pythium oligandrum]
MAEAKAARNRRQRILWDSDNATPDGKTSIGVLLEWLTAPGNYDRWRDGKSQFGETREKLCTEINELMKKNGITHRENANIRTQISELERSYDSAVNWLNQNGYNGQIPPNSDGSENSAALTASVESQVLRLCRYFHVLSAIMNQPADVPRPKRPYKRASLGPRGTGSEHEDDSVDDDAAVAVAVVTNGKSSGGNRALSDGVASTNNTIPTTLPQKRKYSGVTLASAASTTTTTTAVASPAVMPPSNNFASLENTQRMILEAAREDREQKRFQLDEERNRLECEKLRYEIEGKKIELLVQRVLARQKLLEAGISAADVDKMLPAPSV